MSVTIDKDIIVFTEQGDVLNECVSITALTWSDGGITKEDVCDVQTDNGVSIFRVTADKDNGLYQLTPAIPICVDSINITTLDNGHVTVYRR